METRRIVDRVESIQLDAHEGRRDLSGLGVGQECGHGRGRSGSDIGTAVRDHRGGRPRPPPAPAPTSSTRVASLALTTNVPAPQPTGSTIVWTATPTGGSAALVYKWFVHEIGLWRPVGSWTASNQFSWTPTKADAPIASPRGSRVRPRPRTKRKRHRSGRSPSPRDVRSRPHPRPSSTRVASLALTTNLPAPQPTGSTIVWTATPTGGTRSAGL